MRKQHSLFFGESPAESVRKSGANRPVAQRRCARVPLDDIEVRFTNSTVTQFGGYLVWRAFLERIGLNADLARHIKMNRRAGFTAAELSRFFVDSRLLGAERLMHADRMRFDPLLTRSSGLDALASDETMGRYFKSFEESQRRSLDRLNVRLNDRLWKRSRAKRQGPARNGRIILDYDSSTMTVYGKQEGADRGRCFRRKDKPGFQPKFAFIGGLGILANQQLYRQSVNLASQFEDFHAETMSKLPHTARVWAIRGDGALYSQERIRWLEERYTYAISATRTDHLLDALERIPPEDWVEHTDERGRPFSIARLRYRPRTWSKERTYIISRRRKNLKGQTVSFESERYRHFAYVTNYRGPLEDQYRFCVQRCSLENFIKEGKNGFAYDALPCKELDANRAYLGHVQMAYNLFIWWKLLDGPRGVNRWTVDTCRRRLLNICGNLRRRAGRWVLSLPAWWPWRGVYLEFALAAHIRAP